MSEIIRTVTVYDQSTQEKTVLEGVSANTLGELKTILRNNGINLYDMDIREGISRVDLKHDEAILPHDTPYRGGTTNDLLILLTKTNKKVASGLGRSEAVRFIKDNELEEDVKEAFGKSWTNVSTDDLVAFVEQKQSDAPECPATSTNDLKAVKKAILRLAKGLYDADTLDWDTFEEISSILKEAQDDRGFSQDEINDIIRSM